MSQEIVDAVRVLGREKGISEEKLMLALEDALLSAYKKQPGAARYARVRMDRDSGDFRVDELILPAPTQVLEALWTDRALLAPDLAVTTWEVVLGLAAAIAADRAAGKQPSCVVATVGSTSSNAIDPVAAIAEVCQREGVWLENVEIEM